MAYVATVPMEYLADELAKSLLTISILETVQKNRENSVIRKFRTTAFDGYLT